MSVVAAIRGMLEAGFTLEQALSAAEIMEQAAKPAKSSAAIRQQRYRDRKKAEEGITRDVTCATSITRDENRNAVTPEAASRVEYTTLPSEEVITPLTTPSGSTPRKAKSPPLGSRLPDDWSPDIGAAMALGLSQQQAAQQADRFRDYWRAVPGAKGRKLDWPATWRNWCRTALENLPKSRQDHAQRPDAKRAAREENYARAFAASGGIAGG